jgi:hypothetical protein
LEVRNAKKFAATLLEAFGHEQNFEIDVAPGDVDAVCNALTELGCTVSKDEFRPNRINVHCPAKE